MRTTITLGAKIWLVVGLCLAAGGTGIGILLYELNVTIASYESTLRSLQECVRQQDAARVMQVTFKKEVQEWKDILLRGSNPEDLAKYSGQFRGAADKVNGLGSSLQASVTDPEARQAVEAFVQAHVTMRRGYEAALRVFAEAKGANPHQADGLVKGQDRAPTDLIDKTVAVLLRRSSAAVVSEKEAVSSAIRMVTLSVLAAFAMIGGVTGFTIRKLTRTLRFAVEELNEISKQVSSAAAQVSTSSQSLAQSSSEQAAALEETSAATEEINSMACQNSGNSAKAAELMALSQAKFFDTNESLDRVVAATNELNKHSGTIVKIIKTIDEIAFQTNILALNAAVEAARAGEAGTGFAVVADEVRNLAQRSAKAAHDTAELIEESIAKTSSGVNNVNEVVTVIRTITEQSTKAKTLVDTVAAGSQEQSRGIGQIGKTVIQIQRATQSNAATSEETAAAAQELSGQSEVLRSVIERLAAMVGAVE